MEFRRQCDFVQYQSRGDKACYDSAVRWFAVKSSTGSCSKISRCKYHLSLYTQWTLLETFKTWEEAQVAEVLKE